VKAHIYVCAHDALHARGVMMEERGGSQCLEPCTYEERGVHKEIRVECTSWYSSTLSHEFCFLGGRTAADGDAILLFAHYKGGAAGCLLSE